MTLTGGQGAENPMGDLDPWLQERWLHGNGFQDFLWTIVDDEK